VHSEHSRGVVELTRARSVEIARVSRECRRLAMREAEQRCEAPSLSERAEHGSKPERLVVRVGHHGEDAARPQHGIC
jgi:hypothetical protein